MNAKIAPDIYRQRLLIEGYWRISLGEDQVRQYLLELAASLSMRTYAKPIVYAPRGDGREENQGFDAFVPLIDSGISGYFWSKQKFFSIVIYTCKAFDDKTAIKFSNIFFDCEEMPHTLSL